MKTVSASPPRDMSGADAVMSAPDAICMRLERIEALLELLITTKQLPASTEPDESEYWSAITALAQGNKKPLDEYLLKGGKIPMEVE